LSSTGALPDRGLPSLRGEIYVVGSAGGPLRNLTRSRAFESAPALSPDGRRVAYVRADGAHSAIWIMRADGSAQRRLTTGSDEEFAPAWSPDGRRLVYMVWDYGACYPGATKCAVTDAWTINADGTGQRKLFDSALQPRWSPHGRQLLFQRFESNVTSTAVLIGSSDGASVRTVVNATTAGAELVPPGWAPGGRRVVFGVGSAPGGPVLWISRTDGNGRKRIAVGWAPAWSPRGARLAFANANGLWVVRPGRRPRRIVAERIAPHGPRSLSWSPDGKRLASANHGRLSVVSVDSPGRQVLVSLTSCCASLFSSPPAWSPDGKRLYYSA
jgi:Tol biopolymer transport system component